MEHYIRTGQIRQVFHCAAGLTLPGGLRLALLAAAAILGVLCAELPSRQPLWGLWGSWLLAAVLWRRQAWLMAVMFSLALYHALAHVPTPLMDGLARQDVALVGTLAEVETFDQRARLRFEVDSCHPPAGLPGCEGLGSVRLNWYGAPPLAVGERWRLTARMRPPRGLRNPGAFDYGSWLRRQGYGASGYVRDAPAPQRLEAAGFRPRAAAHDWLAARVADDNTRRWLRALTLGEGEALQSEQWELLRVTGTTHLAVISGLHVGMVALATLWLCRRLSRRLWPRSWRMQWWPLPAAALAALGYAGLAGFAPPATRAAIMAVVGLWVMSGRHAPGVWQGWWLALLVVVLAMPDAPFQGGLWLSFGAVAILIVAWRWRARAAGWWALLRTQWLLSLGVGAATLVLFAQLAPLSLLVNLLAVPWVSLLMVPAALLGWLLSPLPLLGALPWWVFGLSADLFETGLELVRRLQPDWQPAAPRLVALAVGLALVCLLSLLPGLTRRFRLLGSALTCTLSLGSSASPLPAHGEVTLIVHDVGQGQLIDIRTASQHWLYDTGPRWRSGFMPLDTLWRGPQDFDEVVISHGDNDHAGGVVALKDNHRVARWWAPSAGEVEGLAAVPCRRGRSQEIDGVRFSFKWPGDGALPQGANERSCVLLIETRHQRLLITGDAGRGVERQLLDALKAPVALLVAGHHGSTTSSSPAFVAALRPRHVLYSAGYLNPYGHPADEVVRRFRAVDSCQWSTALDGAITIDTRGEKLEVAAIRGASGVGCKA